MLHDIVHLFDIHAYTSHSCMVLISTLLSTVESADNAGVNETVTKLNLEKEMNVYITRLCKDVIHLLELGAKMVTDRTRLVKKCCIFYNLLLNIKFAGNCIVIHLEMHKGNLSIDTSSSPLSECVSYVAILML